MVNFFIDRPIFASTIAILMVMAGSICYFLLPVAQFPDITPPQVMQPVDTTAAGDSFNAAYLAARLNRVPPRKAALAGHRLAGAVIMSPGAVIPRAAMPKDILAQSEA